MKGRPVDQLVYEFMFPKPRSSDPQNFHTLLHRNLIPEVRQEVHSFYGHLDTQEAKYPGLDYTHRVHRIRLGRWQWHRRLFRAFDALRLTDSEIANLTKWEGTKWAKERFERDSGVTIHDTAFDDIPKWVEPEDRPQTARATQTETLPQATTTSDECMDGEQEEGEGEENNNEDDDDDDESDGELTSVGVPLNEQLRERAARHEAGDTSLPLDEDWEQWLKNAIEAGEFPFLTEQIIRDSNIALIPQALFPAGMLSAARAGRWQEIPDFLHSILRYALDDEASGRDNSSARIERSMALSFERGITGGRRSLRRNFSDLRLPTSETSTATPEVRLQRTAQSGTQTYITLP
ncbi:uncharacterized protein F4812DRAFT_464275 [Daldinia caldariorum]|uniref:uncharacterized protein n=1 Tax=Daldinia caldariorum TaxID=326644 RepID=UPI0020084312|nr:uncharacterized protein F4812DRAFT_464275 [Daldinia caldariorum]KAI1462882.1 hypothetical protein F4812DRAFT_464275 [Daldinia caldariorum]